MRYIVLTLLLFGLGIVGVNYAFFQGTIPFQVSVDFPFQIQEPRVCSYDTITDTSFQKYLSDATPFVNKTYVPRDLVPIHSSFTANNASKFTLREEAGIYFADLAWHFWDAFSGDKLQIVSAYRSADYQKYLLRTCKKNACAQAGTSEHQAGLGLDLSVRTKRGRAIPLDTDNKYHDWLIHHAHEYGFHNTYQKGVAIDGKIIEPRHRRYVGVELASLLHNNQQTIAEWVASGANQTSCPSI